MKIISWNIWGFNSKGNPRSLKDNITNYKSHIILIQEKRMIASKVSEKNHHYWRNSEVVSVDIVSVAGGLEIMWDPSKVSFNISLTLSTLSLSPLYQLDQINGLVTHLWSLYPA